MDRNQSEIRTQEQTEADFHELKSRSNRLFNRILETWHNDRELSHFFMNIRQETLLKERRDLSDLENDLSDQQQQLARGGNA
ncbi:hypothetical protein B4077_3158 [Bacillus cereus]|uniref:DUF3958 domain-containing protein n=1 Tax=Bacillus cereus TaxID=1396 RepID=A0A0G8EFF9_BACCE|nr:DUF3958 family protein [Bacillus cereus]KLA22212.1 hypothetical protein B4077_3158 [Bacillus cereus]